jgi:Flp pilus assembly protein TadD
MIVKNEEANLAACLRPVCGLVDEIVVVDTGSSDRTKDIARELGARLFDFPWCDDFSAARNESLSRARGDWAFWLDADDRVDDANVQKLARLLAALAEPAAYYMTVLGDDSWRCAGIPHLRLFKLAADVRWQYRVHEQILPALRRRGYPLRSTDVVIRHTGYCSAEVMGRKWERNLRLLLMDTAQHPDDPPVLFHLGMTYSLLGRHAEAVPLLQGVLQPLGPHNPEARFVIGYLVDSLREIGRADLARNHCVQGLRWFPGDPGLQARKRSLAAGSPDGNVPVPEALAAARQSYEAGRLDQAEEQYQEILQADPDQVDALHLLGVITGRTGRYDLAVRYLQAALERKPDLAAAHNNLGMVFVTRGQLPQAVASFRDALRCKPDYGAALNNLGNALRELGHLEEAVAILLESVRLCPDSAEARTNLALAVATQRKRDEECKAPVAADSSAGAARPRRPGE